MRGLFVGEHGRDGSARVQLGKFAAAVVVDKLGVRTPFIHRVVTALKEGPFLARVGEIDIDILLGRSDEGRAGFKSINIDAYIESPDLDEEGKIQFLHEVDRRCPVSETVLNGSSIEINLAESLATI